MKKNNKTFEEELAEIGVRQFVRNIIVKVLQNCDVKKLPSYKEIIDNINKDIYEEFIKIARNESTKVLKEFKVIIKKEL